MFNIPVRPSIRPEKVDGKTILLITVEECSSAEKPIYLKNKGLPRGAYRRIGSTDQRCTEDDLATLFGQRGTETYDETLLPGSEMSDLDPEAIDYYRTLRKRVNPTAEELSWNDEDLLLALSAIKKVNGKYQPTLTGIVLFGNRKALRKILPMSRVDYIRVMGKEWVENPDERFSTTDMRGSLLQLVQRIQDQIFEDLPKAFALDEGSVQAKSQTLPAKVLREAIVNALMHASYRVNQPIQILRYSNRIEIRNPGYSLKNEDQLGEPGSRARNPKIAAVFHETNLAETKGSGIRTMRKLMEDNGFVPPTFESDRGNDQFTATLLLHHFLTQKDMEWLASLNIEDLNDAQKQALIFVRETGAVDNQTYRQINAVDTLSASTDLRRLRDSELLTKKGKGSATYYTTGTKMQKAVISKTHQSDTKTHQFDIPPYIQIGLEGLGKSPRKEKTRYIIQKLCTWRNLSAEELTELLSKTDKKHLVRTHLNPMIDEKLLAYVHPDMVNHPQQKYKAIKDNEKII